MSISTLLRTASFSALLITKLANGQFGTAHQILAEGPVTLRAADLDGDADNDLVGASRAGLFSFENADGQGAMGAADTLATLEVFVHVDDLNGDGEMDLCASVDMGGGIRWYPGNGDGTYAAAQTISPITSALHITSSDLDGDGDRNLVFVLENGDIAWSENTNGDGAFSPLSTIAASQVADHVQVVDLNSDPFDDLLWSSPGFGMVKYALNLGTGSMGPVQQVNTGELGRAGDVDGDGFADLITFSSASGSISWQQNLDGSFSSTISPIATGLYQVSDILIDDLDGDGDRDVAMTQGYPDRIVWFPNGDGSGAFYGEQEVGVGLDSPRSLIAADMDGDGDKELLAASLGQNMYVWYENLSQGSFLISGRVYADVDGNGSFDGPDHGLAGESVRSSDGQVMYTTAGGMYWFSVPAGTYEIGGPHIDDRIFTTDSVRTVTIAVTGEASGGNDFGYAADGSVPQLAVSIATSQRKCGYVINYWLDVVNIGNEMGDVHMQFTLDPLNTFESADPVPASQSGQVFTWDFENLQPTHGRQVLLRVLMPTSAYIGTTLHDTLTAELEQASVVVATSNIVEEHLMTCSFDPNDKQVEPVGATDDHLVALGQRLTYTLRFQNTGTAPAYEVSIVDTLDQNLEIASLKLMGSSHPVVATYGPDRAVHFVFPDIVLPDSTSNEPASHGFVTFNIDPVEGIADMTVVDNAADIYFDLNPAVRTNTVFNTFSEDVVGIEERPVVQPRAELLIVPNPMQESATIHLEDLPYRLNVMVVNAQGQVLRSHRIAGGGTFRLRRDGLLPGVYQVHVVTMQAPAIWRSATLVIE